MFVSTAVRTDLLGTFKTRCEIPMDLWSREWWKLSWVFRLWWRNQLHSIGTIRIRAGSSFGRDTLEDSDYWLARTVGSPYPYYTGLSPAMMEAEMTKLSHDDIRIYPLFRSFHILSTLSRQRFYEHCLDTPWERLPSIWFCLLPLKTDTDSASL